MQSFQYSGKNISQNRKFIMHLVKNKDTSLSTYGNKIKRPLARTMGIHSGDGNNSRAVTLKTPTTIF